MKLQHLVAATTFLCIAFAAWQAPAAEVNYDESQVPAYPLPDPLVNLAGQRITSAQQWWQQRRPEILRLFETEMFGKTPAGPVPLRWEVWDQSDQAWDGAARRKQVTIYLSDRADGPRMDLLLYLPRTVTGPAPVFLALNFGGNQSICNDPQVRVTSSWAEGSEQDGVVDQRTTEASRGRSASRWPIPQVLERGYGVATIYYGDIDPDFDDGFQNGVHPLFYREGQTAPAADEWGSIGAWAWGLSRAMDYLEQDPDVDRHRVIVMGHSRLGKTSLWAGARSTICPRDLEQLRLWRRRAQPPVFRRDGRAHQYGFSALVLRSLQQVQRSRSGAAHRSARIDRTHRAASRPGLQRRRRPLGRPARRIPLMPRSQLGLPTARRRRHAGPRHAAPEPTGRHAHRLPHPPRQTRRHSRRLERLLQFRRP